MRCGGRFTGSAATAATSTAASGESLLDDVDVVADKVDMKPVIKAWLSKHARNVGYNINDDNTIDVNGHLSLYTREIPDYIQFNNISEVAPFWNDLLFYNIQL